MTFKETNPAVDATGFGNTEPTFPKTAHFDSATRERQRAKFAAEIRRLSDVDLLKLARGAASVDRAVRQAA